MEVDNWPRWEQTLMNSPFIHHTAMAYGDYTAALAEACKYIQGVQGIVL
jgi:L-fucose isomerase-like protein